MALPGIVPRVRTDAHELGADIAGHSTLSGNFFAKEFSCYLNFPVSTLSQVLIFGNRGKTAGCGGLCLQSQPLGG